MLMYDPPHPGELILDSMEAMGWDAARCAEKLGVEHRALSLTLDGQSPVTPELATALGRLGWSNAAHWLRLQKSYDEAQTRMREEPPPVWDDISEIPPEDLPHPGVYIRDMMDEDGLTPEDLAEMLGVSLSDALDLINERAPITPEIALALERADHGLAEHWLLNQRSHDESQALLREKAAKAASASPAKVGAA